MRSVQARKRCLTCILLFISLLIACAAAIYAGRSFQADSQPITWHAVQPLSTGWYYQTDAGPVSVPSLPATLHPNDADGGVTLFCRLPDVLPDDPVLDFTSSQMTVEVFLEGQLLYQYGVDSAAPVGKLLGSAWNLVELPGGAAGRELAIRFTSPYASASCRIPAVSLASRADCLYQFVLSHIGIVLFCLIFSLLGVLVLGAAVFFRVKKLSVNYSSLLFLALFLFLATLWVMTDSKFPQLLTRNYTLVYYVSHLSFMLLPAPRMFFLGQTAMCGKRVYDVLGILYILNFLALNTLFFLGIAELEKTLFVTHLLMVTGVIVCVVLLAREWHLHHNKNAAFSLTLIAIIAAALVVSLILFFSVSQENNSLVFRITLFLLMAAMLCKGIAYLVSAERQVLEAQIYQKMAYTDALTGLANRLAFEQQLRALQEQPQPQILTIVILDINGLKHVNDTYGHHAGDDLIQCAARCIQEHFGAAGSCYRIGGDEFVVLLTDFPEQSLPHRLEAFQQTVAAADPGNPEGLSIAVGYASGLTEGEGFAKRLFEQADENMYRHKKAAHA